MKKNIIIGVGIAVLALLVTVWLIFWHTPASGPTNQNPSGNPFPIGGTANNRGTTDGDTLKVTTAVGDTVEVKNFFKDPETVSDNMNSGYYYLGNHFPSDDSTPTQTPPYVIEYIKSTQYFNIALLAEPIGQSRIMAEQYLLQHLGITQEQMCLLNYMVSVPAFVNEQYTSRSLGFSFCPGSVQLP